MPFSPVGSSELLRSQDSDHTYDSLSADAKLVVWHNEHFGPVG
jgi:hypothetical protein